MSVISEGSEREIRYFYMRCFHEIITSKLFPYHLSQPREHSLRLL